MKNLFILICIFLLSVDTKAQVSITTPDAEFGVKIAYGAVLSRPETTVVGNEDNFLIYEVAIENTKPVFQAGLFAQKKIGYLWVEGDLMYSTYGNEFEVKSYLTAEIPVDYYEERFHYIDFQVLGGIHANNFRVGVGPVIHMLVSHKNGLVLPDVYNARPRGLSYGFSGNIGYDWDRLKFDVKFENAFRSVGDHIYYGERQSKFKGTPDMITFSVGISI